MELTLLVVNGRIQMDVLIACGLAAPTGTWGNFLIRGLYDPRLFLWIGAFKGETVDELVRLAVKGIAVEPMPNSLVKHCQSLLFSSELYRSSGIVRILLAEMRLYLHGRTRGGLQGLWRTIRWRACLPRLLKFLQYGGSRNDAVDLCTKMSKEWNSRYNDYAWAFQVQRWRLKQHLFPSRKRKRE